MELFFLFIKKHKILIIIFFLAFLARLAFLSLGLAHNNGDLVATIRGYDYFFEISQNLADGNGFSHKMSAPFTPNQLRPPALPYFIAGIWYVFGSYWAVILIHILLGSLIPVFGFYITKIFFTSIKPAIAVGLFLALEPFSVFLSTIFYSETLFTFLFLIFTFLFLRYLDSNSTRVLSLSALFLALATLTKPTTQYIPIFIGVLLLFHFRKKLSLRVLRQYLIFIFIFMMVISPWLYRNYREFGVVGISAQSAFNLYVYLVPTVRSIENNTSFAKEQEGFLWSRGFVYETINLANSKNYISESIRFLYQHPIGLMKSVGVTVATFFTHDGMLTVLKHAGHSVDMRMSKPALFLLLNSPAEIIHYAREAVKSVAIFVLIFRVIWIALSMLFVYGAFLFFKNKQLTTSFLFALLLVAYFAITTSVNGLGVNARFRVPVNAFIFIFSVYGFYSLNIKKLFGKKVNI